MVNWWKYAYTWNREPVGFKVENASTNPTVKRIDRDGNEVILSADFFWNHELYFTPKVLLSPSGVPTYGSDRIGTGLDFTGAAGDAMVWRNNAQYKYTYESDSDTQFFWYAPYDSNYRGFEYHPHCFAGGGIKHDHYYLGAYEAYGYLDPNDSKYKLGSATGKQPITGGVSYPDCPNSGRFTIGDALTFAANKGAGWTITDIYALGLEQGLFYTQYGTRDSQTAVGKGVVDLASGTGFAGLLTGANNIDENVNAFGTGIGDGTPGTTPVSWSNLQNFTGGNICEFVAGVNVYKDNGAGYVAGEYRLTKPDGTGTIAGTLPTESYVTGVGTVPLTNGYISTVQRDKLGAITFMPATAGDTASGSDKGYCDYAYAPGYNPSIMFSGSYWNNSLIAGVGCRLSTYAPSRSDRYTGARLKYTIQS